jgi:hypothetical protein
VNRDEGRDWQRSIGRKQAKKKGRKWVELAEEGRQF